MGLHLPGIGVIVHGTVSSTGDSSTSIPLSGLVGWNSSSSSSLRTSGFGSQGEIISKCL